LIEIPSAGDFRKRVEEMEEKYGIVDCIYVNCTEEFSQHSLSELNDLLKTRILNSFLFDWGKMQRQLGYEGVNAVYEKMKDRDFANRIESLRNKNLGSSDLTDLNLRDLIITVFDEMKEVSFESNGKTKTAGSTASSKVLHLCCPDFFVMWDYEIRQRYKKWVDYGEDYFKFLVDMKSLLVTLAGTIRALQKKYNKRATRLIDEYNWCIAHKE
jgi:hypothetical protein